MGETLLSILLVVAILAVSAVVTLSFARWMYITCPQCRTLNARRREHCRGCGAELAIPPQPLARIEARKTKSP